MSPGWGGKEFQEPQAEDASSQVQVQVRMLLTSHIHTLTATSDHRATGSDWHTGPLALPVGVVSFHKFVKKKPSFARPRLLHVPMHLYTKLMAVANNITGSFCSTF